MNTYIIGFNRNFAWTFTIKSINPTERNQLKNIFSVKVKVLMFVREKKIDLNYSEYLTFLHFHGLLSL